MFQQGQKIAVKNLTESVVAPIVSLDVCLRLFLNITLVHKQIFRIRQHLVFYWANARGA